MSEASRERRRKKRRRLGIDDGRWRLPKMFTLPPLGQTGLITPGLIGALRRAGHEVTWQDGIGLLVDGREVSEREGKER